MNVNKKPTQRSSVACDVSTHLGLFQAHTKSGIVQMQDQVHVLCKHKYLDTCTMLEEDPNGLKRRMLLNFFVCFLLTFTTIPYTVKTLLGARK